MPLVYLFPRCDEACFAGHSEDQRAPLEYQILTWLAHVARAPLHRELKEYVCGLVAHVDIVTALPDRTTMDERVCMYGLMHACPVKNVQAILSKVLELPSSRSLERLCMRSDGRYGIRISHRGFLHELQALGITVRMLDFTVEYESKTDTLSSMVCACVVCCLDPTLVEL